MRPGTAGVAAATLVALPVVACGGGAVSDEPPAAGGASPAAEAPGRYVRRIAPFPVRKTDGTEYDHPFLGGFDVPRPQLVDIDADGDLDLFVQERSSEVIFLENVGTAAEPDFEWRTDRYAGIDVGEWSRFADLDGDGDLDLLAEEPYSYVRYLRNEGTAGEPTFVPVVDSLRDADGEPIFSDRQNLPSVADVDCDSVPDLFLGRVDGTITRYERSPSAAAPGAGPRFALVAERFQGIQIVGDFGPRPDQLRRPPRREDRSRDRGPTARHGANAMAFSDWDGDGAPDLLWGDFFEPGVLLIRNSGTCRSPSLGGGPVDLPGADSLETSGYNVPVPADIDGDGDLDLLVGVLGGAFDPARTAADNLWLYEREGRDLRLRTRRFVDMIDVGSASLPTLADVDADGDLDLVVGNKVEPADGSSGRLRLFENVGGPAAPELRLGATLDLGELYHPAPAAGDLDDDGDPDLLVGTWNREIIRVRNVGEPDAPRFVADDSAFVTLTRGSNAVPALGDLDADGDLDLVVGESSGTLNLYRNDGDPARPRFVLVTDELGGFDVGRRSHPTLADIDGDGDLDLVVGRESGGVTLYRNVGAPRRADFRRDPTFALPLHPLSAPTLGDVDGDGDDDVVSGTESGGLLYFERAARREPATEIEGGMPG